MPDNKENKTDIVLDENGSALDKDGNKKEKLLADYMSKADVKAIVNEFSNSFNEAIASLSIVAKGASYSEAKDAFSKLIMVVTGGSHVDFAKKNSWITDPAQRNAYLTSGVDQGIADKQFIIDFYKLVAGTTELRAEFAKLLNNCVADFLFTTYLALRFESQMKDMIDFGLYNMLDYAFGEFDAIYIRYNDAKIYDTIPVSKTKYSPEENLEMVLDQMDEDICRKDNLGKFLLGAKKTSPSAMNQLYVIDRETKQFDRFASREDSLQRAIDMCADLNTKVMSAYPMAGDELFLYLDGYRILTEKLVEVFQAAIDVIETFKKETRKVPYCIMHYETNVKSAVAKYSLGTLGDPLTQGTNYRELAQALVSRCQNLAKTVAKLAPK